MIGVLQRLFDAAYLYALDPGPLGRWRLLYVFWALALLTGTLVLAWQARSARASQRLGFRIALAACAAGVLLLGLRLLAPLIPHTAPSDARYLLLDVWTARVWPVSATLVALLGAVSILMAGRQVPHIVQIQIDALCGALSADDPMLPWWQQAAMGICHLCGLALLWFTAERSLLWTIPSLLALSTLPLLARGRRIRLETLAPLVPAYLGTGVTVVLMRWAGVDVGEYQSFAFPDLLSPWFDVSALILAGVGYTLWIQVRLLLSDRPGTQRTKIWAIVLSVALGCWLTAAVVVHRTHGVTASDPYSYVQMAIDLAETGSPLHSFPLANLAYDLGLPTWPTVHIGYHPPFFGDRSPTMWPIGWPLLMVPLYWVGGLDALYWAAPLFSVLALLVTWLTVNEALRTASKPVRWIAATLTCILVATSPEGSERILVPMSDAATQLFTMLVLWLLLRARRYKPGLHGFLAGLSLGMAYLIRHPQLPLALAAGMAAILPSSPGDNLTKRQRLSMLVAFGLGAVLPAIPDLLYHKLVYGGWLRSESTEWFLLSARNIGPALASILRYGLLRREELGFIAPMVVVGGVYLWRKHRPAMGILAAGTAGVFLFHLFYEALRPRDLIAVLPVFYFCAACGLVVAWRWMQAQKRGLPALLMICCALFLAARTHRTLAIPWRNDVVTFGHVSASQRHALSRLSEITPQDAVLGSMLNGGAIELYAGRQAVHPAPWTEDELYTWVDGLREEGRPFYVLDDGEEMTVVLSRLRARYEVNEVTALDLAYFAWGGGNLPRQAVLYRIGSRIEP
jgi:hypothetical protein